MPELKGEKMGIADLHMHTIFSYDGTASVSSVLQRAKQVGLDVIAITDHDVIEGALLAEQLAAQYGIQVIPGIEITTADGDLLALGIHALVPAGLSLIETLIRVGELGGICIAPHPMAGGMGMKSLKFHSVVKAVQHQEAGLFLLGIEVLNATALDRHSSVYARELAYLTGLSRTGSSDAHVLDAIGSGVTEFTGRTVGDLIEALRFGATTPVKNASWSTSRIIGSWARNYLLSTPARLSPVLTHKLPER
jgi:predicted metal-dependent phosphoesterase TrpH